MGDKLGAGAYHSVMKGMAASLIAVVLLGLLVLCPLPLNALTDHSCCHKTQSHPHCPLPTVQDCPYFILEKGKTAANLAAIAPVFIQTASISSTPYSTVSTGERLPDSADLYLQVRVLLI